MPQKTIDNRYEMEARVNMARAFRQCREQGMSSEEARRYVEENHPATQTFLLNAVEIKSLPEMQREYRDYRDNRINLIHYLMTHHKKSLDKAIYIAQKLIDRIVFIAFCEDRGLLPPSSIKKAWEQVPPFSKVTNPRWQNFLELFRSQTHLRQQSVSRETH